MTSGKNSSKNAAETRDDANRPSRKNAATDFESAAKALVAKKAANVSEFRRWAEALKNRPDGSELLRYVPGKKGEKSRVEGMAGSEFRKALDSEDDKKAACDQIRSVLVREISRERILLEERSSALVRTLKNEFRLRGADVTKLETAIKRQSSSELAKPLATFDAREDFLWEALGRPKMLPERSSRMEYLSKIGTEKPGETPDESEERTKRIADWQKAILSGRLTDEQARQIIEEFEHPEDRKILVRALVPNSDLGTLVEKGFVSKEEARNALKKAAKRALGETWDRLSETDRSNVLKSIGPKDVPVSIDDLPETVLKGFVSEVALSGKLAAKLKEEADRGLRDAYEDVDGTFSVEADAYGRTAGNFVRELQKRLSGGTGQKESGLGNIAAFSQPEHLRGDVRKYVMGEVETASGIQHARMEVGPWHDEPGNRGVTVTFYDEAFGRLPLSASQLSFSEFYRILSRFRTGWVYESGEFERYRRSARTDIESVDEQWEVAFETFENLQDLEKRLDLVDPDGAGRLIKKGLSFVVGKPSDAHYNFGTVTNVHEDPTVVNGQRTNGSVTIRNTLGTEQTFSFETFFLLFRDDSVQARRMKHGLSTVSDVITAQSEGLRGNDFKDLSVVTSGGEPKIALKSRQYDSDYEGVKYFVNDDGKGIEITSVGSDGSVSFRFVEDFKQPQPEKDENGGTKKDEAGNVVMAGGSVKVTSASRSYSPEAFHLALEKFGWHPYHAPKMAKVEEIHEPQYETNSFFKGLFHHASWHDIVAGFSKIPNVIKHRLEHSSKHHSAHMALAIAGKLPFFPKEWLVDFERELNSEDKKMLEEDIDHLMALNPPWKRQKQIRAWLLEKNSGTSEILASICAMLEKHGNLYAGELKDLEGKWVYFARLPGDHNEKAAFRAKLQNQYEGRDITEEFVIHEWLKLKAHDLHLNPAYWKMVKDRWEKGSASEKENGGKEAKNWPTFQRRLDYAYGKIVKDQEYSHAIGAMEEVWDKPGPLEDRMKLPFLLAATNIRDGLSTPILQSFTPMFDKGHTYPPLLFVQDPYRQKLFRNVVRKLAAINGYGAEFENILRDFGTGKNNDLIKKMAGFWDDHGEQLTKQLLMQPNDPTILLRCDPDSKIEEYDPELAEYHSIVKGELEDTKLDETEAGMGMYGTNSMNWSTINPGKYAKLIDFQSWPGKLNGNVSIYLFDEFLKSLDAIKNQAFDANDPAKDRAIKKELFRLLHFAMQKNLVSKVSSDWWKNDGPGGCQRAETQEWMGKLMKRGFRLSPTQESKYLEGRDYDAWLERDFDRFMSGEQAPVAVRGTVTKIDDILERPPRSASVRRTDGGTPPPAGPGGGTPPPAPPGPTPPPSNPPNSGNVLPTRTPAPDSTELTDDDRGSDDDWAAATEDHPDSANRPETRTAVPENPPGEESSQAAENESGDRRGTVDRIVAKFGPAVRAYARSRSREMAASLKDLGIKVPTDVDSGEWAYRKIVERFEELEPHEFFQDAEGIEGLIRHELLPYDEITSRIGWEIREAVKNGDAFELGNANAKLASLLDGSDAGKWTADDLFKVGEAAFVGKRYPRVWKLRKKPESEETGDGARLENADEGRESETPEATPEVPTLEKILERGRLADEAFRYRDVDLPESVRKQVESAAAPSAMEYAESLERAYGEYSKESVDEVADQLVEACVEVLRDAWIRPSPFAASRTWALWDIAKQLHFVAHPEKADPKYGIANPLEDQEKMDEILDRHVGWEVWTAYRRMDVASRISWLQRIPEEYRGAAEAVLETEGHVTSKQYAELGAAVTAFFE